IRGYRIELGRVYGETSDWDPISPPLSVYKSYFAGIGRRYGSGFFFEPEIKFMFPVVATYYYHENIPGSYGYPGYDTAVAAGFVLRTNRKSGNGIWFQSLSFGYY
ncbi:MAG: hypothetical protein M1395_08500, partial [Bacteroidetes bacterium]|nr:hypothetical protein [Bacteroidota bacterium]